MSPANNHEKSECTCGQQTLAIASIPKQPWVKPAELACALKRGTIFDNLYFPFYIGGDES